MNKEKALSAFNQYTSNYDLTDIKVTLKISHSLRVADIAEQIGASAGADPSFSWYLGLLHDIGRFEQLKRFGTFYDRKSVDHAELGADILFHEGLINNFPEPEVDDWQWITETAIRLHNKLDLPENMDPETLTYTQILRDADKCDIFRVLTEPPYDKRNEGIVLASKDRTMAPARESIMESVYDHRCVPRTGELTDFESLIGQCCMAFELCFPESRRIAKEQGYLDILINLPLQDESLSRQMTFLRQEVTKFVRQ